MNPEISVGIDELTIVLSADKTLLKGLANWKSKAERMITEFSHSANLEHIFGMKKDLDGKPPQGYTTAYQYGDNPFYFAVAYHPLCPKMGVVVKFSAHSWAVYCQRGWTNIKRFLDSIQSKSYCIRLSRVDFTVDYQDWDISVNDIYQKLINNRLEIHNHKSEANHSGITAYEIDGKVSTFYVGSRKTGTRLFLRVYDKKMEQINNRGFRFKEALDVNSWVRFEAVFKGDYAHQLTDIIMGTDEEKLKELIVEKVAEKYRFYDLESKKYTDFTTALVEKSKEVFPRLRLESPRDNNFFNSLIHLVRSSGLFPTLYKCDEIWGDESSITLLKCLHDIYTDGYEPNEDAQLWLKKHKDTLKKQSLKDDLEMLRMSRIRKAQEELVNNLNTAATTGQKGK